MWSNLQFLADLVEFTAEIFSGKLHFLCSGSAAKTYFRHIIKHIKSSMSDVFIYGLCFYSPWKDRALRYFLHPRKKKTVMRLWLRYMRNIEGRHREVCKNKKRNAKMSIIYATKYVMSSIIIFITAYFKSSEYTYGY